MSKSQVSKQVANLERSLATRVLLKLGDHVSTDEIMPAGEQVLPYRSNIPEFSKFVFARLDETFYPRAIQHLLSGFWSSAEETRVKARAENMPPLRRETSD